MNLNEESGQAVCARRPIDLYELLLAFGLPRGEPVKLYRHTQERIDVVQPEHVDIYQSVQTSRQLGDGLVVFFAGEEGRIARFTGIRRVVSASTYAEASGANFERAKELNFIAPHLYWHELEFVPGFDGLVDRLILQWPSVGRHHRWLVEDRTLKSNPFPVHAIRAIGFNRPFPGFDDLLLTYEELQSLAGREGDGDSSWITALSSTRGVYLITDTHTGELYVGSATGEFSFWGRWSSYARNGHGNNKLLKARVASDVTSKARLQFSILETLSNLATPDDGRAAERLWKRKLGRKAISLNAN